MRITRKRHHPYQRLLSLFLVLSILLSLCILSLPISASAQIYDKATNTAFITEKSARWTDYKNYLAELTLAVNGTQILEPLDVVVVLDRSGSMDMYWH